MQLFFLETTQLPMVSLASFCLRIPSRKLTYPNVCLGKGYVSSQEGIFPHFLLIPRLQPSWRQDTAAIAHLTPAAVDGFSSVLPGAEYAAVHPPQLGGSSQDLWEVVTIVGGNSKIFVNVHPDPWGDDPI